MKKIKKLLLFAAIIAIVAGCCNLPKNGFILKGELKNYKGEKIYLMYGDAFGKSIKDSCIIKDGKFKFEGILEEPANAFLSESEYNLKKLLSGMEIKGISFFISPAKMEFSADWSAEQNADRNYPYTLTGSKTNDEAIIISGMLKNAGEKSIDSLKSFINKYPDSYMSVFYLNIYQSMMQTEEVESLMASLSDQARKYTPFKEIQKEIDAVLAVQPGKPAPDFIRTDINGNTVKLSDFKGKVVLLDFWATWCKPCRASMPHVKALYKKYKNKGLVVICSADNDSDPDVWKQVIEQDGLGEFIHVLRGLKTNEDGTFDKSDDMDDKYAIHTIPQKFLINKDGVLIGVKLDDEQLEAKLKELYGF